MGAIRRDQWPTAAAFGFGLVALTALAVIGNDPFSYASLGFFAAMAWWSWPGRRGRHTAHVEAQAATGPDDVLVYWRPG